MSDLPHDPQAERAVIAAALTSPKALGEVLPIVEADDFHIFAHETIWQAITHLADTGQAVDPVTVPARLAETGDLHRAGGHVGIIDILSTQLTAANAPYHARIVKDRATRRRLVTAATRIGQAAAGYEEPTEDLVTTALTEISAAHRPGSDAPTITDQVWQAMAAIEETTTAGWSWPYLDLRRVLLPPAPGQFILVAARPGVGKSVTLVDIARHVAIRHGLPVVLHCLEMSATEILHRIMAAEARVQLDHIKLNRLTPEEWERLGKATQAIGQAPLTILDNPAAGLAEVRHSIRSHRPAVVLFDYVQLAKTNPDTKDRRQALEEVSRGFKLLAKQEQVPIVAAAQLNRKATERQDRAPAMADLRETGALEQDSDTVVLLHREDVDDPETSRAGEIDLIVAKQRNGPTGKVALAHQLHYSRLVDLEGDG